MLLLSDFGVIGGGWRLGVKRGGGLFFVMDDVWSVGWFLVDQCMDGWGGVIRGWVWKVYIFGTESGCFAVE